MAINKTSTVSSNAGEGKTGNELESKPLLVRQINGQVMSRPMVRPVRLYRGTGEPPSPEDQHEPGPEGTDRETTTYGVDANKYSKGPNDAYTLNGQCIRGT